MIYNFDSFNYFIRLDKGERWSNALAQFAKETGIEGAWLNCIGGVLEVELGFYDLDNKAYKWRMFKGAREITGLQGNIASDENGVTMAHLHGTFADADYQVVGGHVKDFVAAATVEVFIHRSYKPMHRTTDPEVGLQTLVLE